MWSTLEHLHAMDGVKGPKFSSKSLKAVKSDVFFVNTTQTWRIMDFLFAIG